MEEKKTTRVLNQRHVRSKPNLIRIVRKKRKAEKKESKWIYSTDTESKKKIIAPLRVITGSKKIVFQEELNLDGGYKRQKGSGFIWTNQKPYRWRLGSIVDCPEPLIGWLIDQTERERGWYWFTGIDRLGALGASIRISTSFESLWRSGLFFGGGGVLFGVRFSFLSPSPYVRSRITRRTHFGFFPFFTCLFLRYALVSWYVSGCWCDWSEDTLRIWYLLGVHFWYLYLALDVTDRNLSDLDLCLAYRVHTMDGVIWTTIFWSSFSAWHDTHTNRPALETSHILTIQ